MCRQRQFVGGLVFSRRRLFARQPEGDKKGGEEAGGVDGGV